MKPQLKLVITGVGAFAAGAVLVFFLTRASTNSSGGGDEGATKSPVQLKRSTDGESIVVLDADTQKRIGLAVTNLVATQWQPEVKGYGSVIDPATLAAAIADLETARAAADVSNKEYDRLKALADQNSVSAKSLEEARAASTRDQLAFETSRAKFATGWGKRLSENAAEIPGSLAADRATLFRIDLPAGEISVSPRGARILSVNDGEVFNDAKFFDAGVGVDPQTQMQSFLFQGGGSSLKPGAAVEGFVSIEGGAISGVEIPAGAVLRHEGKAWIYLQTGEGEFTRREIPDFGLNGGWFTRDLNATNRVVIIGAQTLLSAELSSGGFNTGERD
jgi:hypothetical protein